MANDEQARVIEFLASPATHGGAAVERIDTHSAVVFLAGERALKLKRAVRFDYLDFSTAERRREACEAEVRLNRRTAPSIYRGVVAVTREADGSLAIGGAGEPVDWCLDMVRFDQDQLLDRLAARQALDVLVIERLAESIARFHLEAAPRQDHGGGAGMAWVIDGNAEGFAQFGATSLDQGACAALTGDLRREAARHAALLDRRRAGGFVRQCHGDLHLRNIVLLDGEPTLFDAVEFNDEIACVDVLYDLAFLLMDLWHRGLRRHANALLNGYLARTLDLEGLALLPLFLSCRAAVRAKTSATAAALQPSGSGRRDAEARARAYLALAGGLLRPAPPRLIAIGGLSGTGKSTLARALAPELPPVPGALVLRSDIVRKSIAGVPPSQRLPAEGYARDMSIRVYGAVADRARAALASGWPVIVDAVFAGAAERAALADVARQVPAPFTGLWLEAPGDLLAARVSRRTGDASDADAAVVRAQLAVDPGPIDWPILDASAAPGVVLDAARALVDGMRVALPATGELT